MKIKKETGPKAEVRKLEWWESVPQGERNFLGNVMQMIRSAKGSHLPEVARAAAKWETGLGFFIKVRLMHERRFGAKPRAVISSPTTLRNRSDASLDRD